MVEEHDDRGVEDGQSWSNVQLPFTRAESVGDRKGRWEKRKE